MCAPSFNVEILLRVVEKQPLKTVKYPKIICDASLCFFPGFFVQEVAVPSVIVVIVKHCFKSAV